MLQFGPLVKSGLQMKPLPDLKDDIAMARLGRQAALRSARRDAMAALSGLVAAAQV